MTPDARRRLGALTALAIGLFIGLALLPLPFTGPVGDVLGRSLWELLGAGAIGLPVLGVALALAGFERLGSLDMKRAALLLVGLSLLVPYLIGVLSRVTVSDLNANGVLAHAVGALPGPG